jgi:hypothetical protein
MSEAVDDSSWLRGNSCLAIARLSAPRASSRLQRRRPQTSVEAASVSTASRAPCTHGRSHFGRVKTAVSESPAQSCWQHRIERSLRCGLHAVATASPAARGLRDTAARSGPTTLDVATRAAPAGRCWWHLPRAGRGGSARRRSRRGHRREECGVSTCAVRRAAAAVCDATAQLVEAPELRYGRSVLQALLTRELPVPCCRRAHRKSVRSRMCPFDLVVGFETSVSESRRRWHRRRSRHPARYG